jgi:hypothetical protein
MLAVQCLIIFSEPFDAMGFETVSEAVQLLFFAITFLVYLIVRGPIATTLAISALISDLAGYVLDLVEPSKTSLILGYAGLILAFIMACYALGYAALAPGVVTVHRVLGTIGLYLNIGLMFAIRRIAEPGLSTRRAVPTFLIADGPFAARPVFSRAGGLLTSRRAMRLPSSILNRRKKKPSASRRLGVVNDQRRSTGVLRRALVAGYGAKQPVRLAVDPICEVEGIGTAVVAAHPELDRPKAARAHAAGVDRERPVKLPVARDESVDFAMGQS